MNYKQRIKQGFALLSQKGGISEQEIEKYFHQNYRQYVDGKQLNYNGFVAHMNAQQKVVEDMNVRIKNIVEEGNIVFTNHIVDIVKKDGAKIKIQVIAEFTFEDDKVICCDELTHLIKGSDEDRDIGSRTH